MFNFKKQVDPEPLAVFEAPETFKEKLIRIFFTNSINKRILGKKAYKEMKKHVSK